MTVRATMFSSSNPEKNVDKKEKGRKKSYNWETNNRDAAAFNFLKHAVSITRSFQMHQVS